MTPPAEGERARVVDEQDLKTRFRRTFGNWVDAESSDVGDLCAALVVDVRSALRALNLSAIEGAPAAGERAAGIRAVTATPPPSATTPAASPRVEPPPHEN